MTRNHRHPAARRLALGALSALLLLPLAGHADTAERLAETLTINGQEVPVKGVRETPLPGLWEIRLESGETFYSNAEGSLLLVGDLYENAEGGLVNLTEQDRNDERVARLAEVPERQRVIFRGDGESQAVIAVFTDTTCPYCRRLHEEVPRLNQLGIEVHYLAFPRAGLNGEGARQMRQVWCAEDRSEAMTTAKRSGQLEGNGGCDNPIEDQYHLGRELGVEGTPAIVLPDGRLVPGYVPAERLVAMLGLEG